MYAELEGELEGKGSRQGTNGGHDPHPDKPKEVTAPKKKVWKPIKGYIGGRHPETGEQHGFGVMELPYGKVYKSMWDNGQMHGQGELDDRGHIYQGEFKNGKRHGHGKIFYESSYSYVGEFLNDKQHG